MLKTPPRMKLSSEEHVFLRHWMFDEVHFEAVGPAKRLQVEHGIVPADLAAVMAAAMPDPEEQQACSHTSPPGDPVWPWSSKTEFLDRLKTAKEVLFQEPASRRDNDP